MDRIKKLNGSMIAAIVLSVLLIMSISFGATLAWFASRDSASATLTMGEAVVVTVGEDYKQGHGELSMALPVADGGLLPGMSVTPNIKVQLQGSNTNALLRARFITTVEYPDNYVDAAYEDTTKYPDSATVADTNKVLDNYNVYKGVIYYDYYTPTGKLSQTAGADGTWGTADDGVYEEVGTNHSKTVNLTRVEVRQEIVDKIGQKHTINGIEVQVTKENIAALEIRQRGIDLTDAVNRVLSGERGYVLDATGKPVLDATNGIKYTRRVADGWAYRQADQAWYYLGSQTNGFVLQNQTGVDETVTATAVAKDITKYTATTVGNVSVQRPTYTALTGHDTRDNSRNYLGTPDATWGTITPTANEAAVLTQASIASVDLSQGNVSIDFLTKRFVLPRFIDNKYAKANITFNFTVEAVQDYLIDPLQEGTAAADRLPNNLANAILVFNNAFPQAQVTGADAERQLSATGTVANILPNGGTSVTWDTTTGTATVLPASSAILTDSTDPTLESTAIKGFGVKDDEYGDKVADYTKQAAWQHGTASSIGVAPFLPASPGPDGP